MGKQHSDIFICRLEEGDYWAYPSPFVAHGGDSKIQFRNLTDDTIEIDFGSAPVSKTKLSLGSMAAASVNVNRDAPAGLYEYVAELNPAKKITAPATVRRILVKGGSPPRIIIDT